MPGLPRIVLEPTPDAAAYAITVETPEGAPRPVTPSEFAELADGLAALALDGTGDDMRLQLTVGRVHPEAIHWSDRRLKRDVRPLRVADRLRQVRGVSYRWRRGEEHRRRELGVLAQDVERAFPDAVAAGADGMLRVDYAALVAVLVQAMNELEERVRRLEAKP